MTSMVPTPESASISSGRRVSIGAHFIFALGWLRAAVRAAAWSASIPPTVLNLREAVSIPYDNAPVPQNRSSMLCVEFTTELDTPMACPLVDRGEAARTKTVVSVELSLSFIIFVSAVQ